MVQLQRLQQPSCQSQILTDASILQQLPQGQPNVASDYSIDLCKNLATAVQNMVLSKLSQNAYRKPIFNQIAGPLLSDIALRTQSQCPVCGNANVMQSLVNAPYSQVQTLGNQGVSYQAFVNPINSQVQALYSPLQANQVQALVDPIQNFGNQMQTVSYGNLNQAQSCPCNGQPLRFPGAQNLNQNANAAQQYSEALAALESLKNGNGCACGQRGGFNLF